MLRSKRLAALAVLTFSVALPVMAAEPALPALFRKMKDEFSRAQYKEALADTELLDRLSREPGKEADRRQLESVIAFYRAANLSALGEHDSARTLFISYLVSVPNAVIASPAFPKGVVKDFNDARKELGTTGDNSLVVNYADFHPGPEAAVAADEHWADSAVRLLLTKEQSRQWAALKTADERKAFVEAFWKPLDPTPADEDNPLRREIERRMLFADAKMSTDKKPGRETDRGLVFTLLGPPNYVGRADITGADDPVESMRGGAFNSDSQSQKGSSSRGLAGNSQLGMDTISGAQPASTAGLGDRFSRGTREAWVYRKGRLSPAMRYPEIKINFITRQGYGDGILQRDPDVLQALGQAAELVTTGKALN